MESEMLWKSFAWVDQLYVVALVLILLYYFYFALWCSWIENRQSCSIQLSARALCKDKWKFENEISDFLSFKKMLPLGIVAG